MWALYYLGIALYSGILNLVAPFSPKARLFVSGRRYWRNELKEKRESGKKYIWMHCASLGEFEQGRPVLEELRKSYPGYGIAVTFYSPSGYEVRKNYEGADIVMYLPVDLRGNVRYFLETLSPSVAIFVKYEFWFGYLNQLQKRNIPTYLISAVFRRDQFFFKPWASGFFKILSGINHFFVQDASSRDLLISKGLREVTLSGDTRYDRVLGNAQKPRRFPEIEEWLEGRPCIVAGSTWAPDDEALFPWKQKDWAMIVAPHEVNESRIRQIEVSCGTPSVRYSQLNKAGKAHPAPLLIIDNVGMLMGVYALGRVAYVGGAFGGALHNILEPAALGLPVIFGPKHQKFPEAAALQAAGGARSIATKDQFRNAFRYFSGENHAGASESCRNFVLTRKGATMVILNHLQDVLAERQ